MSSTNRGYERHKTDYYITPQKDIEEFFNAWKEDGMSAGESTIFLDPCAGGDKENNMPYPEVIKRIFPNSQIKTIDIRTDSKAEISADYLNHTLRYEPDIIITNPPFYLAKEIIEKALKDVRRGGVCGYVITT